MKRKGQWRYNTTFFTLEVSCQKALLLGNDSLKPTKYCHVNECDYRRGLDWRLDLLSTLTHDS
jgi:hypothetical protein